MSASYWRIWVSLIVITLAFVSIVCTSFLGFAAAVLSAILVCIILLQGFEQGEICGILGLLIAAIGIYGAVRENPQLEQAIEIAALAGRVDLEPRKFDATLEHQQEARRVMWACGFENYVTAGKMGADAASAIYEPPEFGFFSWALKPQTDRINCLNAANSLAAKSNSFRVQLDDIMKP